MKQFFLISFLILGIAGCKKGDLLENNAPDTRISVESINLSGSDRLNSIVHLSWFGTDKDGYIKGYEISFNGQDWEPVQVRDSVFRFSIEAGSDTTDADFFVRAIDNQNLPDPSPAYLRIPLKNTPPAIDIDNTRLPGDSVQTVLSFSWSAEDADGNETIDSVFIKINQGPWVPLKSTARFASLVPANDSVAGITSAILYYGINDPQPDQIPGLEVNGWNTVYLKVMDFAGAESEMDSTHPIFIKQRTSDLLLIAANNLQPNAFYTGMVNAVYSNGYDLVNYAAATGANQPKFWNPTFNILLSRYDKVILYADDINYVNAQDGQSKPILESAASGLQQYLDNGGKALISAKFPTGFSKNSPLFGTMPMDSLSSAPGQAIISTDSLITSPLSYPTLKPGEFILGADPFYHSTDAEVVYRAGLSPNGGWYGPRTISARRKLNGKVNLHFFSVELHKLNGDPNATQTYFNQVLNADFNW